MTNNVASPLVLTNEQLLCIVFTHCPLKSLPACSLVSKFWRNVAENDSMWLDKYIKEAGLPPQSAMRCKRRGIWKQMFLKRFGQYFQLKQLLSKYSETNNPCYLSKFAQIAWLRSKSSIHYGGDVDLPYQIEKLLRESGGEYLPWARNAYHVAIGSVTIYSQSSLANVTIYVDVMEEYEVDDYVACMEGHVRIGARIFDYESEYENPNFAFPLAKIERTAYRNEGKTSNIHCVADECCVFSGNYIPSGCDKALQVLNIDGLSAKQLVEHSFMTIFNDHFSDVNILKYSVHEPIEEIKRNMRDAYNCYNASQIALLEAKKHELIQRTNYRGVNKAVKTMLESSHYTKWFENYGNKLTTRDFLTRPCTGYYIKKEVFGVVQLGDSPSYNIRFEAEGLVGHEIRCSFILGKTTFHFVDNEFPTDESICALNIGEINIMDIFTFGVVFADMLPFIYDNKKHIEEWHSKDKEYLHNIFDWSQVRYKYEVVEKEKKALLDSYDWDFAGTEYESDEEVTITHAIRVGY